MAQTALTLVKQIGNHKAFLNTLHIGGKQTMYFDQRFLKSQSISGDLLGMNMVVQYCFL
jgi:hypothetical protein